MSNKIQRNYTGLKITASEQQNTKKLSGTKNKCMHRGLEQILDKRYRETKKPNCHFWRAWNKNRVSGTKTGCWEQKQGTEHAPLNSIPPEGWANHLSHLPSQNPGHTATFTPYKEQAWPASERRQAREAVACSCSPCCSTGPNKPLLKEKNGVLTKYV